MAEKTENYTGADIAAIVREAAMLALREKFVGIKNKDETTIRNSLKDIKITMKHFEKAIEKYGPSIDPEVVRAYEEFMKNFRRGINKRNSSRYLG